MLRSPAFSIIRTTSRHRYCFAISRTTPPDRYLLTVYGGTALRSGALYRVTPSMGMGLTWWGDGAPPWRHRIPLTVGKAQARRWGVVLSLGATQGKSLDMVVTSPTGSFSESISVYLRAR